MLKHFGGGGVWEDGEFWGFWGVFFVWWGGGGGGVFPGVLVVGVFSVCSCWSRWGGGGFAKTWSLSGFREFSLCRVHIAWYASVMLGSASKGNLLTASILVFRAVP